MKEKKSRFNIPMAFAGGGLGMTFMARPAAMSFPQTGPFFLCIGLLTTLCAVGCGFLFREM